MGKRDGKMRLTGKAFKGRWLALAGSLLLVLVACAPDEATDESQETEAADPAGREMSGEVLRIGVRENPPTLAHHYARSAFEGTILRNIHEVLVGRDPVTDELVPELAVAWEQIDTLTWRFELREGVEFHDGTPLTAEAVAFGLEYSWSEENNFFLRNLMATEMEFVAVDEFTLEVRLEEEDPLLLKRLWHSTIPSADQIQNRIETYEDEPIGTGPYRFVRWDRDREVVLEINPDWWGFDEGYDSTQMFEEVHFVIREDESARISAFRAGEIDFGERIPPMICMGELPEDCVTAPQSDTVYAWFDAIESNPVHLDPRVRRALSLTIPREEIARHLLLGSEPAALPVAPGVTGYADDLKPVEYDPERAKELLDEAAADGVPVYEVPMLVRMREGSFPSNTEVLEVVLNEWRALGLPIEGVVEERSVYNEGTLTPRDEIPPGRNHVWFHKHTNNLYDSGAVLAPRFSCNPTSRHCVPEIAEMLFEADRLSGDSRHEAYQEIWRLLYDDAAFAAVVHQQLTHLVSDGIVWDPPLDMTILVKNIKPQS